MEFNKLSERSRKIPGEIIVFLLFWVLILAMVVVTFSYSAITNNETNFLTNFDFWIYLVFIPYTVMGITYIITQNKFSTIKTIIIIELSINLVYDWPYIIFLWLLGIELFKDLNQIRTPYGFYHYEMTYLIYLIVSIILFILAILTYFYADKYYKLAIPSTIFALGVVPMPVVNFFDEIPIWFLLLLQQAGYSIVWSRYYVDKRFFYDYNLIIFLTQIIVLIIGLMIIISFNLYEKGNISDIKTKIISKFKKFIFH